MAYVLQRFRRTTCVLAGETPAVRFRNFLQEKAISWKCFPGLSRRPCFENNCGYCAKAEFKDISNHENTLSRIVEREEE